MKIFKPVAALLALVMLPAAGLAADDVAALRAQLQELKSDYSARMEALASRIQQLEASAGQSAAAPMPPPPDPEPAPAPAGAGGSAAAFNPSISLILGGSFTDTARDPADWQIAGFVPNGEIGPGERSFNLGESELTLSASIDPYFSGVLTAAISGENEIEVEEAFVRSAALPEGFTAKVGRFFSGLGYLNEVHGHAWDFVDQPLAYQALFGGQFAQNGVQLKWLAPTDLFVELGAETGNGDGFPGTRRAGNGFNGATLFAHVGGDLGANSSFRAGGSWLTQDAENRPSLGDEFTGDTQTWVIDGLFKWAPSPRRQLKVQGEYLRRRASGQMLLDPAGLAALTNYRNRQSGWYLQGVYQFAARWRAGLRYDSLDSGVAHYDVATPVGFLPGAARHPERLSLMLDWNPSEFSRLRAQYDWDDARDDGQRDRILRLQYLFGLGAHGAHKY